MDPKGFVHKGTSVGRGLPFRTLSSTQIPLAEGLVGDLGTISKNHHKVSQPTRMAIAFRVGRPQSTPNHLSPQPEVEEQKGRRRGKESAMCH